MREVIKVDCKGFLPKEFDAFDADLLVLFALLLGLGIRLSILPKWLAELVDTVFLSRFICLHQNYLFERHWILIPIFKFSVISLFLGNFDGNEGFSLLDCAGVLA